MSIRVAIEINNDNFKLCCIEQIKNAGRVLNLIRKEFDPAASEKEISELIKNTLNNLKIKINSVLCVLPRHLTTVRLIKLPSIVENELQGMVDIQTIRLIPYPKEELIYDYQVIAEENNQYSWTQVGIAHREIVNRIFKILSAAELSVESLNLSTDATLAWFTHSAGVDNQIIVLSNIDDSFLDVSVVHNNLIIFSRSISSKNLKLDPDSVSMEIKKTIEGFKKEELFLANTERFKINKIVLMGNKFMCEATKTTLSEDASMPVSFMDFGAFDKEGQDLKELYLKTSFCNVLGLLFNQGKIMNFVPQENRNKFETVKNRRHYTYIGLLSMGILIIFTFIIFKNSQDKSKVINYLNSKIKEEEKLSEDVKVAKSRLAAIKDWGAEKRLCIDILRELYRLATNEISLTVLNYDSNTPLILQGSAQKMSDIFKFISVLEQSELFENVQIRYATKRKFRDQELADFQINCPFTGSQMTQEKTTDKHR